MIKLNHYITPSGVGLTSIFKEHYKTNPNNLFIFNSSYGYDEYKVLYKEDSNITKHINGFYVPCDNGFKVGYNVPSFVIDQLRDIADSGGSIFIESDHVICKNIPSKSMKIINMLKALSDMLDIEITVNWFEKIPLAISLDNAPKNSNAVYLSNDIKESYLTLYYFFYKFITNSELVSGVKSRSGVGNLSEFRKLDNGMQMYNFSDNNLIYINSSPLFVKNLTINKNIDLFKEMDKLNIEYIDIEILNKITETSN